jgi:hypothetical protein
MPTRALNGNIAAQKPRKHAGLRLIADLSSLIFCVEAAAGKVALWLALEASIMHPNHDVTRHLCQVTKEQAPCCSPDRKLPN